MSPPPADITLTSPPTSSELDESEAGLAEGVPRIIYYLPYREAKNRVVAPFEQRYLRMLRATHGANLSAASRASGLSRRHLRALYRKHGLR